MRARVSDFRSASILGPVSLRPRSRTVCEETGMPRFTSFAAAGAARAASAAVLMWTFAQTFPDFASFRARASVMRAGFSTGARVQMRTRSTWPSDANASTKAVTCASGSVRTSPPERRTSRTFGGRGTSSTHFASAAGESTVGVFPRIHRRVQWAQVPKQRSVVITSTRSGKRCLSPGVFWAVESSLNGSWENSVFIVEQRGGNETERKRVVAQDLGRDGDVASLERLERVDPRALEADGELAGVGLVVRHDDLARTVTDAGAERLRDGLLGAPEADDRLGRVGGLRRELELVVREDGGGELLGEIARNGLDVDADAGVRRGERDHELRGVGDRDVDLRREVVPPGAEGVGLAGVVGPDLDVRIAPPRLVVVLQEAAHRLLRGDAAEQPLGPPRGGPGHRLELVALPGGEV